MPLPVNVDTCTVVGRFVNSDGSVPTGTVEFAPIPRRVADASSTPPYSIMRKPAVVTLDSSGDFTVTLIATDDPDLDPVDWLYRVSVRLNAGGRAVAAYSFEMNAPAGETVDLAHVTPV